MSDDIGAALMVIGWLGGGVTMVLHIVGVLAGWWGTTGVTWVLPLAFLALMQLGGAIDA